MVRRKIRRERSVRRKTDQENNHPLSQWVVTSEEGGCEEEGTSSAPVPAPVGRVEETAPALTHPSAPVPSPDPPSQEELQDPEGQEEGDISGKLHNEVPGPRPTQPEEVGKWLASHRPAGGLGVPPHHLHNSAGRPPGVQASLDQVLG